MSTRKRLSAPQNRNYRQSEDAKITGYDSGLWTLQVEGRDYADTDVGGTWLDADNPVGDLARIAFVNANPLLPIFFSRGSKPLAAFVDTAGEDFLGLWVRQEARLYGRFWLGDPETPVITAGDITPEEARPVQGPLRSYGDFLTWAADSTLTEYEPATGASTETEHTGPIVAVWDDGETWVLTQVDTTPAGYDEGYSDGYAATEGFGSGSPYNEGANACINETPYDPSGSNPGPPEVEGTEEYIDGYNAGWTSGWQINYDAGYEGAGCTIPEE